MPAKVILDGQEWGITDNTTHDVAIQIKTAMENGTVVALDLLDQTATPVTVYFNGRTAVTAALSLATNPKPTEISD